MSGTESIMAFGVGSMSLGATVLLTILFTVLGKNGSIDGQFESILGLFVCIVGLGFSTIFYAVAIIA